MDYVNQHRNFYAYMCLHSSERKKTLEIEL